MHKSIRALAIAAIIIFQGLAGSVQTQAKQSASNETQSIISKMTVEEKVGQVMLGFF